MKTSLMRVLSYGNNKIFTCPQVG
ncbi:hypothetical protein Goarm_006255 [Gossypium armourianum]|uniref:Uncharacterized protein n=1 Tax=Gossypium armourianum TaxID=34283 RepID=A0A7J9JK04_9ROSI|nr:hypothetical protein [Gossypium armourianum]